MTNDTVTAGHARALAWLQRGPKQMLIGGRWLPARSGQTFDAVDPSTDRTLVTVAAGESDDVDAAVAAARAAFDAPTWSGIAPDVRTRALLRIADAVEEHAEELAVLESLDMGAPITATRARALAAAEIFRYYAGWPSKIFGRTDPWDASGFLYTLREPMGVCGQINAWNVPLATFAIKIGTALACGNTVVFKPAEQAPLTALRLAELIQETDLPPGVLNLVPGLGTTAGAAIANHPDVDKLAFTGSTAVGKQILHASTGNLKKVTLELGGKSPHIVFSDADIDKAVQAAAQSFCGNSGQVCSAGTRLFVQREIHDEVVQRVARLAADFKVGAPFEAGSQLGPIINGRQLDRVMSYLRQGQQEGARVELGGARVDRQGNFMTPTVFSQVTNDMAIAREEIFGPVLAVVPFTDAHDAVFQGNQSTYGLAAGVWTRDVTQAHTVARALKTGRVWINAYGQSGPVMSFGGYKQSGYGREQGAESIEAYTQTKSVFLRL